MERDPILKIAWDLEGVFKHRINRFLGTVLVSSPTGEAIIHVHVHDPGRLRELLFEGNPVRIKRVESDTRKTQWDLIAAQRGAEWVLTHTGFHRAIAQGILARKQNEILQGFSKVTAEVTVGESRLDFVAEGENSTRLGLEVKGCTLVQGDTALFPDAPTSRGTRHLRTLKNMITQGDQACLIVLIFGENARCFVPNTIMDPAFSIAFYEGINAGMRVIPLVFVYEGETIYYLRQIPLCKSS